MELNEIKKLLKDKTYTKDHEVLASCLKMSCAIPDDIAFVD